MGKSKFILFFLVFAVMAIGIIYQQNRFYRTPLVIEPVTVSMEEQMVSGGPPFDGIPPINEPQFESIAFADQYLDDQGSGIVLEIGQRARFYPHQILLWHLVVNEMIADRPIAVTYDPLSASDVVFDRTVDGQPVKFSASGKLFQSNLLMRDDHTNRFWSQQNITLPLLPSLTTTWEQFKRVYPNGQVLSRETGFVRDYTYNPYGSYESSHALWYPVLFQDARFEAKTIVYGLEIGSQSKAYPKELIEKEKTLSDEVGGVPVLLVWDDELSTARAYKKTVDEQIPLMRSYWFSWFTFHPNTQ